MYIINNAKDIIKECVLKFLIYFLIRNKNTSKTKFLQTAEVILIYSAIVLAVSSTFYYQITNNSIVTSAANVSYGVYFLSFILIFIAKKIPKLFGKILN